MVLTLVAVKLPKLIFVSLVLKSSIICIEVFCPVQPCVQAVVAFVSDKWPIGIEKLPVIFFEASDSPP